MISGDNEVVAAKDEVPCFVECPGDCQGLAFYMGVVLLSTVCVAVAGECQFPAGLATRRFIRRTGAVFLSEGETDAVLAPVSGHVWFPSLVKYLDPLGDSLDDLALGLCKGGIQYIVPVEGGRGDRSSRNGRSSSVED